MSEMLMSRKDLERLLECLKTSRPALTFAMDLVGGEHRDRYTRAFTTNLTWSNRIAKWLDGMSKKTLEDTFPPECWVQLAKEEAMLRHPSVGLDIDDGNG